MNPQSRTFRTALLALPVLALTFPARAEWPERPVTVVMPYRAGGGGENGSELESDASRSRRRGRRGGRGRSRSTQSGKNG